MRVSFGPLACFFLHTVALPALLKRDADFEQVKTSLDRSHQDMDEKEPDKYFHESSFHQHYDGRFAKIPLKYDERRSHLTALAQTYLSTMNDIGIETWLMHGSLLGWWWNRKIMPWDSDLDVMVSEKSIDHLAAYYNMTVHHHTLTGFDESRDYLLEINPHHRNSSVDSVNKIDARWIDMDTGLFIDITTLRRNRTAEALGIEGAMMVKDKHHYMYDDIFPLRESSFEDSPVKVPYAYADLLIEEYGERALSDVRFDNHRFDAEKQEWVLLRCEDVGSCFLFRNQPDGFYRPLENVLDRIKERPVMKVTDGGKPGIYMPPKPITNGDEEISRPMPPRLLTGRPWPRGRWQD